MATAHKIARTVYQLLKTGEPYREESAADYDHKRRERERRQLERRAQKLGYTDGEVSWTLEDNVLINRPIEMMGAKRYKTYRMYEGPV